MCTNINQLLLLLLLPLKGGVSVQVARVVEVEVTRADGGSLLLAPRHHSHHHLLLLLLLLHSLGLLHQIHLLRHQPGVVMASTLAITTITTPQQQIVELGCLHKIRMQPMKQAKILPQGQKMLDIIISRVPHVFM